jgi:ABC-2 type transporter
VTIELPYVLVQSVLYGVIVYSMMNFQWTAAKFFWYLFYMYFTLLYFTFYGMLCVGLTPSYNIAAIVSSAFYGIWNVFSGFIIARPVSSFILILTYKEGQTVSGLIVYRSEPKVRRKVLSSLR